MQKSIILTHLGSDKGTCTWFWNKVIRWTSCTSEWQRLTACRKREGTSLYPADFLAVPAGIYLLTRSSDGPERLWFQIVFLTMCEQTSNSNDKAGWQQEEMQNAKGDPDFATQEGNWSHYSNKPVDLSTACLCWARNCWVKVGSKIPVSFLMGVGWGT